MLQLSSTRGAKQKAADSILAAFLLRPLEGREEPNEALKRPKFIRWMNLVRGEMTRWH